MNLLWQPGMTLAQIEKQVILYAYRFFGNNKSKTAQALGIAYRTIRYKLVEYGVTNDEQDDIDGEASEQGDGMEPCKEISAKQSMPVREREEIQEMSSRQASRNSARKSGTRN